MSRLRFTTAGDLLDAFPTAAVDIGIVDPRESPSADFLRQLVGRREFRAALSFCAYLLARREAVWWGCQSVREAGELLPGERPLVEAAEAWVRSPDEEHRLGALDLAGKSDTNLAGCWICFGAGWAGGTIKVDAEHSVPVAPQSTAQAVRAGVILAAARLVDADRAAIQQRWVEACVKLAQGSGKR